MRVIPLLILSLTASSAALAAPTLADLKLFKSSGMTKGLWQMQLLSSNDATLTQGAAAAGKIGFCMDVAQKLSEQGKLEKQDCQPTVLKNTDAEAEVNVVCADGQKSHVTITRESPQSFVIASDVTVKDQAPRNFKARYTYQGACKGDSVIQMDKSSQACKQMNQMDMAKMAAMCDKAPEGYRAQCEQQMKQMAGMCQ